MGDPIVGIDCSPLLVRSAGVKTYLFHWLRAMRQINPGAVRTFLAPWDLAQLDHGGGLRRHPLQLAELITLNRLPRIATSLASPRCDIFHVSNLLRRLPSRPLLSATVHDLTGWILPEAHTAVTVAAEEAFAERVLKRAAGLIADSENTKCDAVRILGIAPERIHVIHLGVPDAYSNVSAAEAERVVAARELQTPYYLSVGTIEPRKNIDTLLDAWAMLPSDFRRERTLAIAGMPGWHSNATMNRIRQAEAERGGVRYLGYVAEADLPGLTAGARALVYPSLYEGFGLPVAQAMAARCPVITSNVSSLPEVAGDAAILVDPRSAAELASAIRRMDESEELRVRLAEWGRERARSFTWSRAARKSLEYFRQLRG